MKVLYVATVSWTIRSFLMPHIELLIDARHQVNIACHVVNNQVESLRQKFGDRIYNIPFNRRLFSRDNLEAYRSLKKIILEGNYDIIHTHTLIASAIVRLICIDKKIRARVFYTAHGFHFYKGAPVKNWLIYYPIERFLSRFTDTLIAINGEDYYLAQHDFHAKRTVFIPGVGLDIQHFDNIQVDCRKKRKELGVKSDSALLLSVGELNDNKNHALVLRALKIINQPHIEYVICGDGDLEAELLEMVEDFGLTGRVHLLGKRNDVQEILKVADIFVYPSKREGLPVALMEAMASGLPIICSDIRGNADLVRSGVGGYLFKSNSLGSLIRMLQRLLKESDNFAGFANNNQSLVRKYSLENVLMELVEIYD